MKLPEVVLDDRTFQELVNEARLRVAQSCPEWTEHNVSDPGITLIELFAWMTELTIYRLNRVPEKLHVALLELLGIRLDPPSAAQADVRFRLVDGVPGAVRIPAALTEVGAPRTSSENPVVFQVAEDFTVEPLRPAAYVLKRGGQVGDIGVADGVARPTGPDQLAFGAPPQPGDALHLGFDGSIGRLVLEIEVEGSQARGAGVDPEDPPLRWEVSGGDGSWLACEVLEDRTGGFNYGGGTVELQLPARSGPEALGGHRLHWVRCRIDERTLSGREGATYTHPPEIYSITARPVGALLPTVHSVAVTEEPLGLSDGTPGQVFPLRERPVLPLTSRETLEVQDPETRRWQAWEVRESLASSGPDDLHFAIDLVSGEVELGPSIRQTNGGWRQYGAVPPKGAALRMTGYRHGGGRDGNVAAGTLTMLKSSVPGIDRVANPGAARGGVDAEQLDRARQRAGMELRSRYRAVTADDFEFLAQEASPLVARAVCTPPTDEEPAVVVSLLRRVDPADRPLEYAELVPDEHMYAQVGAYLDERRVIGTTVRLAPMTIRGVSVIVNLQTSPTADVVRVTEDVTHALYTYLNPLVGGSALGPGEGWPRGRPLNQGELYGIIHGVDGVEFVTVLRLYDTDLQTGEQAAQAAGSHILIEPDEVLASGTHIVKVTRRPV